MSWTEDTCPDHAGFVHTGSNCIMCVEDAALQRGADAARIECAGIVNLMAEGIHYEEVGASDIAAAILERVGKPVKKEDNQPDDSIK